jgi:Zn-dependent peptidase ImmA (M78 family)
MRECLASKLKAARMLCGISTRAVAARLNPRFRISHATIANYEAAKSVPPLDVLGGLAQVYDRPLNWFLERGNRLTGVQYRNLKSRVRMADLHAFEADVQRWLDAYVGIEARLDRPLGSKVIEFQACNADRPDGLARRVRELLAIGPAEPVPSVVDVLEHFGVRVLENATSLAVDGLAARYMDQFVVVLNPAVSNDRCRMSAAHELAHVLRGDCEVDGNATKGAEARAFEFASHFLLPNPGLKSAFAGRSIVRLVQFKERFGISLAAMVYRAEKLGFISKPRAKALWVDFARRGWKTNEPGYVRPDRATRLEQLIDEILSSGTMSLKEVADLAGVRPEAVRTRLDLAMGIQRDSASQDAAAQIVRFPD